MKRPLVPVVLLYAGGILISRFIPLPTIPLLSVSMVFCALAFITFRWRPALLCPLLVLTGMTNLALRSAILSPNDLRNLLSSEPAIVTVRGKLLETPTLRVYERNSKESWRSMTRLEVTALRLDKGEWRPAIGRVAIASPGTLTNLFADQVVEVSGVIAPPKPAAAEGLFDYRAFLEEQGIYFRLQTDNERDWQILESPTRPPLADRFRGWGQQALALGLPTEDESLRLEWALTLGWKTALTEEVSEPFIRAATYHIFAVDGLRMAIIFGIFFGLFRALGVPRATIGLLALPVLWFYVSLTGWPASAIRAMVMLTVVIVGWALKRPPELINSLFAAAFIILIWEPQQLFQAGFQLSFFVVLCIILTVPVLHALGKRLFAPDPYLPEQLHRRWHPIVRVPALFIWDLILVSFASWLGSLPLVAYYFNIITPVSTPANILAVPLCALVLISNLASLLLASWFQAAAILFNHAGWFLMECIRVSSEWFARWPQAWFYVPAPSLFTSVLFYALLIAIVTGWLFNKKLRAWKIGGATLLIITWAIVVSHDFSTIKLTILPSNGGSAIFFDPPGTAGDLLVNSGNESSVQFVTKPFLRAQGVDQLSNFLLAHGESRRIGGAEFLMRQFPPRKVFVGPAKFRSVVYRRIIDTLRSTPDRLHTLSREDHVPFQPSRPNQHDSSDQFPFPPRPGSGTEEEVSIPPLSPSDAPTSAIASEATADRALSPWTVLHPDSTDHFQRADDNSLVLTGTIADTRILLLSDLGRPGQNALLERYPELQADIVITGLPVQTEPLCDSLLDRLRPRLIIVTDSEVPASERASPKLCERLAHRKVPILYTRSTGAITLEFRRDNWDLRTMNGLRMNKKSLGL